MFKQKLVKFLTYAFSREFLIKLLIISVIYFLVRGEFTFRHDVRSYLESGYGGFEIKLKTVE
jgi:hypothetical protein